MECSEVVRQAHAIARASTGRRVFSAAMSRMSRFARQAAEAKREADLERFADEVEREWHALGWRKYL